MNTREIETKILITGKGTSYRKLVNLLNLELEGDISHSVSGKCTDYYWKPPVTSNLDFIRMRSSSGTEGKSLKLTVKHTDRDTQVNRLELEGDIDPSQLKVMREIMSQVAGGSPLGDISKKYHVLWFNGLGSRNTLSIEEVQSCDLIVEAEGDTLANMDKLKSKVLEILSRHNIGHEIVPWSIYQRYLLGE